MDAPFVVGMLYVSLEVRALDPLAGRLVLLLVLSRPVRQAVHLRSEPDILADRHAVGLVFEVTAGLGVVGGDSFVATRGMKRSDS